jgi:hypothetical protein
MSTSSIQLPGDFVSNVLAGATATLSNLGPYVELIVGVLLAVTVIGILVGIFRH